MAHIEFSSHENNSMAQAPSKGPFAPHPNTFVISSTCLLLCESIPGARDRRKDGDAVTEPRKATLVKQAIRSLEYIELMGD